MVNTIKSTILKIGDSAIFEDYKILILFGEKAPIGIDEISVIHRFENEINEEMLVEGSSIIFGNQKYKIENIGHVANETLHDLGHATLYFGLDEGTDLLPGSILLSPSIMPTIAVGDTIQFVK